MNHAPTEKERGAVKGYYAVALLKGGGTVFKYMTAQDCLDHGKKHSKTWDAKESKFNSYSPWSSDPDSMCMKTVLIQLAKVLPLSVELQRAISVDETSRDYRQGIRDLAQAPDTTNWNGGEVANGEIVDSRGNSDGLQGIPGVFDKKPSEVKEGPNGEVVE